MSALNRARASLGSVLCPTIAKMPARADTDALTSLPDVQVAAIGDALRDAGFGEELLARTEAIVPNQLDRVRLPLVRRALRAWATPASVCARLFAYEDRVDERDAVAALGAIAYAALRDAGMLIEDADGLVARVRMMPLGGLMFASDEFSAEGDPVMGPGATTQELARAMGAPRGRVLDVGCGAGSLALIARARGAESVVGVDIDPRAIAYARFNTRLNRLDAAWDVGDLTEPVAGQRFDSVVSQPPFVVRPEGFDATTYLHGGARGDELALRLLGALDGLLAADGRAVVLFDTPTDRGPALGERIRGALGAVRLDSFVLAATGLSPDQASVGYAAAADATLGSRYHDLATRYRDHFDRQAITGLSHILLVVVRASGAPRSVVLHPRTLRGYDAEGIAQLQRDVATAARDDEALWRSRLFAAPGALLVQEQSLTGPDEVRTRVAFTRGRGIEQELSDTAGLLLTCLRDEPLVSAAAQSYAEQLELGTQAVAAEVLSFVRNALIGGLLTSAE